jgi:hypothetical protein
MGGGIRTEGILLHPRPLGLDPGGGRKKRVELVNQRSDAGWLRGNYAARGVSVQRRQKCYTLLFSNIGG